MEIREPAVAGKFYEKDPGLLRNEVQELFDGQESANSYADVRALILPHAGYVFSGQVAASALMKIDPEKHFKTIFLIASSHHFLFGNVSVYAGDAYRTPLGEVPVDKDVANKLIEKNDFVEYAPVVHRSEHGNEVQIPLLQYYLKYSFKIVPIVITSQEPDTCKQLAKALEEYYQPENLFIVSSDFSHYPEYDIAVDVDAETAELICSKNAEKLYDAVKAFHDDGLPNLLTALCGWTSVLTLMHLAEDKKLQDFNRVTYANSGDSEYGSKQKVVGYWAIALIDKGKKEFEISHKAQEILLDAARHSIVCRVLGREKADLNTLRHDDVNANLGAFVSVYVNGDLRGCLGRFNPEKRLLETVSELAASAAKEDRRFESIKEHDLSGLSIEISVLSPMHKIDDVDEIELGKHGVLLRKGTATGTFLPQVASQTGWSLDEFLGHCAKEKARIGWDGWKNADIYVYEAFVFKGML